VHFFFPFQGGAVKNPPAKTSTRLPFVNIRLILWRVSPLVSGANLPLFPSHLGTGTPPPSAGRFCGMHKGIFLFSRLWSPALLEEIPGTCVPFSPAKKLSWIICTSLFPRFGEFLFLFFLRYETCSPLFLPMKLEDKSFFFYPLPLTRSDPPSSRPPSFFPSR